MSNLQPVLEGWGRGAEEHCELAKELDDHVLEPEEVECFEAPHCVSEIMAVGKNYKDHVNEVQSFLPTASTALPEHPIIFSKHRSSAAGSSANIKRPQSPAAELDYEGELAIVIGRNGWLFCCCFNDLTNREAQRRHQQWFLGKSGPQFAPMGPFLVPLHHLPRDDSGEPDLTLETRVNGHVRQAGRTSNVVFGVHRLIESVASVIEPSVGDVIATGTPAGVGAGFDPPRYLQQGDTVEVSIDYLGTLRNRIVE